MSVLLLQLDGSLPNIALMRIAAHHRALGDEVELRHGAAFERGLWDWDSFDHVYASAIFMKTKPLVERLLRVYPDAIVGGTGWLMQRTLEDFGITTLKQDYSIYPNERRSIGFTQRGCRLSCPFCVVPAKEGKVRVSQSPLEIWRGPEYPKQLLLLDNDFFGQPDWRSVAAQIRNHHFKVCFSQGINARFLDDEGAECLASLDYRANNMIDRRIYTAWDSKHDENRLFAGLNRLVRYGVRPRHILVYMLIGYWPGETEEDRLYRWRKLRDFGCLPFPMPYRSTPELSGFARWCIRRYDDRASWAEFKAARFAPQNVPYPEERAMPLLEVLP